MTTQEENATLKAENKVLETEASRYQALRAIIGSYSWMAAGRGCFAYDDPAYDEDVRMFVSELINCLPPHKEQPFQQVLVERNNLKTDNVSLRKVCEDLKVSLGLMTAERDDYRKRHYGRGK